MTMRRIVLSLVALASIVSFAPAAHAQVRVVVPGVRVGVAPPPARVEVRPMAPSREHVWIPGHWAWRSGAHVWIGGHYALPPGAGYHYVQARWVNEGGQWIFYE